MCGICGIVASHAGPDRLDRRAEIETMLSALLHRGPDGSGISGDERATFGAVRLAIRGTSAGQQPVVDADTGVIAVCNGEIDNHRELRAWLAQRGRRVSLDTDIGVIPGLYLEKGEAFVESLVGAFAIAVWDPRSRTIILARDRAGERPLYYRQSGRGLVFASELAALVSLDECVERDPRCIGQFLQNGYFSEDITPYREIRRVRPAEIVTIGPRGATHRRYWRWTPGAAAAEAPSLDEFDRAFRLAVERQSDVDVEHGVFLSGGVDSSLIAAVAAQSAQKKPLKAFTLRFDESSYDEGGFAEQVATQLGMQSVSVDVGPGAVPGVLSDLIRHCGEPLADPAWIPTMLLAKRASQDVGIALVGEGADELFAGYPTYIGALAAGTYGKLPRPIRAAFKSAVERWPVSDKKVAISFLLKRFVQSAELDEMRRHLVWTSSIPAEILQRLGQHPRQMDSDDGKLVSLDRLQRHDFETSLADGLLTKADRAGMRWGLETRAPFLDVSIMELAARIPQGARAKGLSTKIYLKRYAERYLPKSIVYRRKRGLSVPLSAWLRDPLYPWAREMLSATALDSAGLDLGAVADLLQEHRDRKADHARALWTLIVLSEWLAWDAGRPKSVREQSRNRRVAAEVAHDRTPVQ